MFRAAEAVPALRGGVARARGTPCGEARTAAPTNGTAPLPILSMRPALAAPLAAHAATHARRRRYTKADESKMKDLNLQLEKMLSAVQQKR